MDLQPFILTLEVALLTTAILFAVGVPIAYWLYFSSFRLKILVESVLTLPLILPPSVLGFYLLLAFTPMGGLGAFLDRLGIRLVFTFHGLVVASVIYSLPFMVQPVLAGFRTLSPSLAEASYSLGKNRMVTLLRVLLPNIKPALITACILTFAHTVGEFGVVLMVGGNIPGETRMVSVAIYDAVEAMNYGLANTYSIVLLLFSFFLLVTVYLINHSIYQKPQQP